MPAATGEQRPEKNRSMCLYLRGIHESYKVGGTHSTPSPNAQHPTPNTMREGAPSLVLPPHGPRRYVV